MSKKDYEAGGRNVFQDIGAPDADEHLVKAQLVFKIGAIMKTRRMKQKLDQDVEIVVRPHRHKNNPPALHVS